MEKERSDRKVKGRRERKRERERERESCGKINETEK